MAFGTEPNAYERSTGPASNFSLYPPDDAVRVPGEPPLDGGLFSLYFSKEAYSIARWWALEEL